MQKRSHLWVKSLLLAVPLAFLSVLTVLSTLRQARRVGADVGALQHEISRTLQAEVTGRSFYVEIKEYADVLLDDEGVREEIADSRRQVREAFETWQSMSHDNQSDRVATLADEYQRLQALADIALDSWDEGELENAPVPHRQEALFGTARDLLWLADDILRDQELVLDRAFERLRSGAHSGLFSWLGLTDRIDRVAPHLRRTIEAARFSRFFYAELYSYSDLLVAGHSSQPQSIERSRRRAERSLELWRGSPEELDEAAERRQRLATLDRDIAEFRVAADEVLNLAMASSGEAAMELLEERVEMLTREEILPNIDALVRTERDAVETEMRAVTRLMVGLLNAAYGASALILIVGLAALHTLRNSILRPLGELRSAIERIGQGRGEQIQVTVRSKDEIGLLGTAFNTMTRELSHSRKALEERTREAEEAKRQAEFANQVKSEFLTNMNHEIRTPLNGLVASCNLLCQQTIEPELSVYGEIVSKSVDSLVSVVDEVLDAAQLMTGKIRIEPIPFAARETVSDIVELLRPQAHAKNLRLDLHFADNVPRTTFGDPARLRQVLLQLIGNALKFTTSGGVTIEAAYVAVEDGPGHLRIDVSDTGIGIPEDQLEAIFEPFAQADGSLTRRHGGAGLGLSISRQLVELMGGRLQVSSRVGKGSIFTVDLELPMASPAPPPTTEPTSDRTDAGDGGS